MTALTEHLDHPEITMLVGPRQSGKTTILKQLDAQLRAGGRNTLWLNLDVEDDFRHLASQGALLQKIRLELGSSGVVFMDEIQRKENAGLFLKGLYDQALPWKFVVSGSGSIELKEKISESLAGRKRVFELATVSFGEFADFRTGYRYADRLREFFRAEPARTEQLFREYLMYGGYPRVVLAETHQEKLAVINEIFRSYLEKDIVYLLRVEKSDSFSNLVRVLASQTGKRVSYSELSANLGLSLPTVKTYLWYLEKTFIIRKVNPWFTNIIFMMMVGVICVFGFYSDGNTQGKADRWIHYGTSKNGDHYYDKNSMTHVSPKIIQVWGKTKYSKFGKEQQIQLRIQRRFSIAGWDKFDYDITFREVDCSKNTYKILKIINYNDAGEIFQNIDNPNPSTIQTPPGSMGETFLKIICSER